MTRHAYDKRPENLWGMLQYPIPVYKHWIVNNWNYFTKPKLIRKIDEWKNRKSQY